MKLIFVALKTEAALKGKHKALSSNAHFTVIVFVLQKNEQKILRLKRDSHIKDWSLSNAHYTFIFGCQNVPYCNIKINTMCLYKSTKPRRSYFSASSPRETTTELGKGLKVLPYRSSSNVIFNVFQRVINFCQSFFDSQCCESGWWALVPTLLHEFSDGC